ncbi:hypothetical protein HYU23_01845 [Candidatus Woesearchaeota archaeon]|nr:hypothetical protein [Candidatus Woesearchaeota archaeon]
MPDDSIITYEKLYEVLRLEKYKKELQKLDLDFYKKVINYLEEKKSILKSQESKDSVFASQSISKTKRQLENTKMILKELYERREGKIIQMALFSSRTSEKSEETDALIDEELSFYKSLVNIFGKYKLGILENILNNKMPLIDKKEEKKSKTLKFLHPIPQFIGDDMQVYGPFEQEDIAVIPNRVSEILIKNNKAEEL